MELGLTGRTVVITGGSSGIGKAVAWEYLKEGCHVAICSRGQARLEDAVRELQAAGYSVFARSLDVTDYPAVERFADEVAEAYGKIDVWYNNAASNQTKSLMDYSYDEFRSSTEALLISVFAGCKIAAAHMRKTGGGVILNASSYSAVIPNAGRAPYSACKSAVSSLTRAGPRPDPGAGLCPRLDRHRDHQGSHCQKSGRPALRHPLPSVWPP